DISPTGECLEDVFGADIVNMLCDATKCIAPRLKYACVNDLNPTNYNSITHYCYLLAISCPMLLDISCGGLIQQLERAQQELVGHKMYSPYKSHLELICWDGLNF
ncbi:hypothetical protein GGF41_001670, partial [Coemansia sp. RSA 2531]